MMTDDLQKPEVSLVKKLRERGGRIPTEAADRIEELEQEVMRWHGLFDEKHNLLMATKDKAEAAILDLMAERYRAEARLAKAVELLKEARQDLEDYITNEWPKSEHPVYERKWHRDMELCRRIDAALAEIEGGKTDD